ncbi:MAG: hypothetical protein HY644_02440 [Acidobacteria bacterium]|nr:hypothetical protein [Acidobacteriota bacterium]
MRKGALLTLRGSMQVRNIYRTVLRAGIRVATLLPAVRDEVKTQKGTAIVGSCPNASVFGRRNSE